MKNPILSRRGFVVGGATIGTGLTIGLLSGCDQPPSEISEPAKIDSGPVPEVNAWVHIGRDEIVTVRVVRSEMGQGTLTGLAQLVAEELGCDWSNVVTEFPTPGESIARDRVWGEFATGGSRGLRGSHEYVRQGGAAARMMLVQAAAQEWEVPSEECSVSAGVITHAPTGKTTTFGAVTEAAGSSIRLRIFRLRTPPNGPLSGNPN